ncbi:MAG: B12-binding domain-containing radical SAM protein [bacterium]|nr:B12-binding domain-containing radical SAM protein [bacterium]
MAKVVLIDPPNGRNRNIRPQLWSLHLAAMILDAELDGVEVEILDFTTDKNAPERLPALLKSGDVLCVGITALIGSILTGGLEVAGIVRKYAPKIPIVWGGVQTTMVPRSILKHELSDAVCLGEGEESFVEMVRAYKNRDSIEGIRGIGFKKKGELVFTPPRDKFFSLDNLPSLPYHLVNLDLFRAAPNSFFAIDKTRIMSIETSRGCPYCCGYCVNTSKGETFRQAGADTVLRLMEDIVKLGVTGITINDDNFFSNKKRAFHILESIAKQQWNLEIFVAARSDFLSKLEPDNYRLMENAGIKMLGIGVESGSNRILESIDKNETIEHTFEAAHRLGKTGIRSWYHFLYGFPGETKWDVIQTQYAMTRILKEDPQSQVNLNKLMPIPCTPVYKACIKKGWNSPSTIGEWALIQEYIKNGKTPYFEPGVEDWVKSNMKDVTFPTSNREKLQFATRAHLRGEKDAHRLALRVALLDKWLENKTDGKRLRDYFNENEIDTIGVYGLGTIGKRFIHQLKCEACHTDAAKVTNQERLKVKRRG